MIFRSPFSLCRVDAKLLPDSQLLFLERLFEFLPLELKKSPRSPRPGSSGNSSQLFSLKARKDGKQIGEGESSQERAPLLILRSRGKQNRESGIPRNFAEFRVIPQKKNQKPSKGVLEPLGMNKPSSRSSKTAVKSQVCGSKSPSRKGTKKAPEAGNPLKSEVPCDFLQSFKSCRGHHLFNRISSLGWPVGGVGPDDIATSATWPCPVEYPVHVLQLPTGRLVGLGIRPRDTVNISIELHDSIVAGIMKRNGEVVVHFLPAYLHKSEGRPGIDAGTGWVQEARLNFADGLTGGTFPDLPCVVMEGELVVGVERFNSQVPVPLAVTAHGRAKSFL